MAVVPGHELAPADCRPSSTAGRAVAARNHGRDDDLTITPVLGGMAAFDDATGDLMAEDERERVPGRDAVNGEAYVGVADAAARHLDHDIVWFGSEIVQRARLEPAAYRSQVKAVRGGLCHRFSERDRIGRRRSNIEASKGPGENGVNH
jgi:hypothetical protein